MRVNRLSTGIDTGPTSGQRSGVRWEDRIDGLFDDLEQQAEGLALVERDTEVAELSRAEYASVDLAARLHGSVGARVRLAVTGVGTLEGELSRVGEGWCLLDAGRDEWIVRGPAIGSMRGLRDRAVAAASRPATARLGLASALRGIVDGRGTAVLHRIDGSLLRGRLGRVGADFVEVADGEARHGVETVPFVSLAAVRSD
jgi:hypothetical protein